jgi:hypothetical protein
MDDALRMEICNDSIRRINDAENFDVLVQFGERWEILFVSLSNGQTNTLAFRNSTSKPQWTCAVDGLFIVDWNEPDVTPITPIFIPSNSLMKYGCTWGRAPENLGSEVKLMFALAIGKSTFCTNCERTDVPSSNSWFLFTLTFTHFQCTMNTTRVGERDEEGNQSSYPKVIVSYPNKFKKCAVAC